MSQIAVWDFRITKSLLTKEDIINDLKKVAKHYIFQEETGDTGYSHFQGRISLVKKRRVTEKLKILDLLEHKWEYFEPTVNAEFTTGSFSYVMKADTRVDGPYADTDEVIYIPRQAREIKEWRPWQKTMMDQLEVWDTRSINIIYDPNGNIGKSVLCCFLGSTKRARILPPVNDMKDLLRMVCDMPTSRCYIIDMPRALGKDRQYGLFSGIETIKSGYAYDDRYSFKEKWFDSPNIWMFTNQWPDLNNMSMDRWKMFTVINETLVSCASERPK